MRRVLSSLIVLAILVGMFVCLGAQAFAAQEDIAVFAVADEQLNSEMIARLQEQCSGSLLIDVNGFAEGQDQLGYDIVWVEQDPVVMAMNLTDAAKVWPGFAVRQEVGPDAQPVIVVGVGDATTAEEVAAALTSAGADGTEFTVAVGPAAAAEAVKNQVKLFLVSGESDGAVSDLEGTKVVHVAKAGAPVAAVFVGADGAITSADNMPLPEAADPNVGIVEPQAGDPNAGPVENEQSNEPEPTQAPLYDVVYKGNGGGGAMQDDFDFQSDLEYYFRQNGYTAPEGQEFAGWMIDGDETATLYQPNDPIYLDRDITVLAQWKQVDNSSPADGGTNDLGIGLGPGPITSLVKVSFEANGGSGTMEQQDAALNAGFILPENGFTAPAGSHFLCWQDVNAVDYNPGDSYMITGETTFTAQWVEDDEPEPTFTVTYKAGDGAQGANVTVTATETQQLGMIPLPADFSKDGYVFTGWIMDGRSYNVGDPFYVSADTVITAEWTAEDDAKDMVIYTITYEPNGGTNDTNAALQTPVDFTGIDAANRYFGLPENFFTPPAGSQFTGWLCSADQKVYAPSASDPNAGRVLLSGDVTFTAQWEPITQQPVGYVVHFYAGSDNAGGFMEDATVTDGKLLLPECKFTVPGLVFDGWNVGAEQPAAAGTTIDVTGPMDIYATWKHIENSFTITYKANGGEGADTTDTAAENQQITLPAASFTAPAGQEFSHWTIENGDSTQYPAGSFYTVTADVTFVANWKEKASQDPGATTTDMLMYTQGGTDEPTVTFANAKIATVSFDNYALTNGTQFALSNNDQTITLNSEFLDTQATGQHNVAMTFQNGPDGTAYTSQNLILEIKAPPSVSPETNPGSRTIQQDWARTGSWTHTFDKAPTLVQIYYGTNNGLPVYQTAKANVDYTVSGNTLTLLPALVNGNWGGQWPNATYSFRVTLNNDANDVYTLQLKLTGEAPAATAAPTQSPVPNNANVPVTGDETPLVLYIVILVVLIAALAAVIIVVMKRKNSGRGRH